MEGAFFHPADGHEVYEGTDHAAAEFVFGHAGEAGVVGDGDFDDIEAADFDEGGEEAVHAFVEGEAFEALAFVDFESAGGVFDGVAGEPVTDAVGDFGLDFPSPAIFIGTVFSPLKTMLL